jgi:hypothetical protein
VARDRVTIDVSELESLFDCVGAAGSGDFRKEAETFLKEIAENFLQIVEDEIIRKNAVDTRLLVSSFQELSSGGLTVEVGTDVTYASYVNDGHWTNPKGVKTRWVPGRWSGERFVYDPGAKTGMLLKQEWVSGKHFWESSLRAIEKLIPGFLEKRMNEWLADYFGM